MGRHSRRGGSSRGKLALATAAAAGCEGLGIFLVSWGNHLSATDYTYDVIPWALWGTFFIAAPLLVLALQVIVGVAKAAAAEHRRYVAWKETLPHEQRAAIELAEAAALTAAAIAAHERHKRTNARLSASVMGYTMPDGRTPRPSQRIAAYQQQAPRAPGLGTGPNPARP